MTMVVDTMNSPNAAHNHDRYPDHYIRRILASTKTIAMVGASPDWSRPSYFAMKYLQEKGYRVIPVNPRAAGQTILGEKVYERLDAVPAPFQMVDVFRNSDAAGSITDEAIALAQDKGIQVIWMQLGVRNDAAAARAEAAGLRVVMNRCPKIEWGRLNNELSWGGFNSRIITAKRRRI
ncbi:CoA-binding protein [Limibacillus sp. MBR-115]|jgi:predicted CoA-binding protein|uniref:CoA-binding protein n=1 Tax=Limibacillus sp. MBR-115 TaxID=3156465 RepID=UPI0033923737